MLTARSNGGWQAARRQSHARRVFSPMTEIDPPLILLPGMAADGRLFRHQRTALPCLRTPDWIAPLDREPLAEYAQRFAQAINPGRRCFVGGASFGGLVALEMAAHLQAEACF